MNDVESVGKALSKIAKRLSKDQEIARLLIYTNNDPLSEQNQDIDLKREETSLFRKNIRVVPKIALEDIKQGYILVISPYASANENDNFSTVSIVLDVILPISMWEIDSDSLRPFLIMSRIKKLINKSNVSGIGELEFVDFSLDIPEDEVSIYRMIFSVDCSG